MRELKTEQGEYIHIVSKNINLVKVGVEGGKKEGEEVLLAKQNKRFIETMVKTSTYIQRKNKHLTSNSC